MKLKLTLLPSLLLMVTLITAGCNTGIPTGETERLYKPDTIGEFDEYQFSWGINL